MSRIGKAPIEVPSGVTVQIDGHKVLVKGPKGQLEKTFRPELDFKQENGKVSVLLVSEDRVARGYHGLTRTLLANMIKGVSAGFERQLEIVGVGYRATMDGKKLVMQLGYSHPVEIMPPDGITITVGKKNDITVAGIDKQAVGDMTAFIREKRPPEVYKGKGIKFQGEVVRRKAGKAAGKKK